MLRSLWTGRSLDLTLGAIDGGVQLRGWPSHHGSPGLKWGKVFPQRSSTDGGGT